MLILFWQVTEQRGNNLCDVTKPDRSQYVISKSTSSRPQCFKEWRASGLSMQSQSSEKPSQISSAHTETSGRPAQKVTPVHMNSAQQMSQAAPVAIRPSDDLGVTPESSGAKERSKIVPIFKAKPKQAYHSYPAANGKADKPKLKPIFRKAVSSTTPVITDTTTSFKAMSTTSQQTTCGLSNTPQTKTPQTMTPQTKPQTTPMFTASKTASASVVAPAGIKPMFSKQKTSASGPSFATKSMLPPKGSAVTARVGTCTPGKSANVTSRATPQSTVAPSPRAGGGGVGINTPSSQSIKRKLQVSISTHTVAT